MLPGRGLLPGHGPRPGRGLAETRKRHSELSSDSEHGFQGSESGFKLKAVNLKLSVRRLAALPA